MMKIRRLLIVPAILMASGPVIFAQDPVANWGFNENTGTTTTDLAGSIVGTFTGDVTWSDDAYTGTSILLDGDGDYVETDSSTLTETLRQADNFAITAYFKANHLVAGQQHIVWIGNTAANGWGPESEINITIGHFNTAFQTPLLTFYYGSGDIGDPDQIHMVVQDPPGLDSTSWHHIAAVVSGAGSASATGELYLDGQLLTPMTTDETTYAQAETAGEVIDRATWNSGFLFGVGGNKTQRFFDGRIDNVRVYTEYLNSDAVNDDLIASARSVYADSENAVFPNPVQGNIVYLQDYSNIISAEVLAMDGKVLRRTAVTSAAINLSGLASGIYLIRVTDTAGNRELHKIMKE
jgi:hypothetical protein